MQIIKESIGGIDRFEEFSWTKFWNRNDVGCVV